MLSLRDAIAIAIARHRYTQMHTNVLYCCQQIWSDLLVALENMIFLRFLFISRYWNCMNRKKHIIASPKRQLATYAIHPFVYTVDSTNILMMAHEYRSEISSNGDAKCYAANKTRFVQSRYERWKRERLCAVCCCFGSLTTFLHYATQFATKKKMFSYLFGILVLFVSIRVHMFQRTRSHTYTERIYNKWIGSLIYYSYELKAYPAALPLNWTHKRQLWRWLYIEQNHRETHANSCEGPQSANFPFCLDSLNRKVRNFIFSEFNWRCLSSWWIFESWNGMQLFANWATLQCFSAL